MSGAPSTFERYARRYLKLVTKTCAREHREPGDYFLTIGKYDADRIVLAPRSTAEETIAIAQSKAQREKLRALLAMPCERRQLLVIITAGDDAEGQLVRVPTTGPDAKKLLISRAEMDAIERYQQGFAPIFQVIVDDNKRKMADFVAVLRPPDEKPVLALRALARPLLEQEGLGDLASEVDVPAVNDRELLCIYKLRGTPTWSRLEFDPGGYLLVKSRTVHQSLRVGPDEVTLPRETLRLRSKFDTWLAKAPGLWSRESYEIPIHELRGRPATPDRDFDDAREIFWWVCASRQRELRDKFVMLLVPLRSGKKLDRTVPAWPSLVSEMSETPPSIHVMNATALLPYHEERYIAPIVVRIPGDLRTSCYYQCWRYQDNRRSEEWTREVRLVTPIS